MIRDDRIRYHAELVKAIKAGNLRRIQEIENQGYEYNEEIERGQSPIVDDNSLILVAVQAKQLEPLEYLLVNAGLDPALDNNFALKAAYKIYKNGNKADKRIALDMLYELIQHPFVREDLFLNCKSNLTTDQAKFLLFEPYPIEEADVLYKIFMDEDEDEDFVEYEDSEEDDFDDDDEEDEYDEDDVFVESDDSMSKEGQAQLAELLIDVKKKRKEKMEKEKPYSPKYGEYDLYDIGKRLERGEITKSQAQKIVEDEWYNRLSYKGELFQDMKWPFSEFSYGDLEEFGMAQKTDFIWYYDVKNDELETLPGEGYSLDDIPKDNGFRGEYYLFVFAK